MSDLEIRTNNVPRDIIYGSELTDKEKSEFEYLEDVEGNTFFKFKGCIYDIGEFMAVETDRETTPEVFNKWHGYQSDSYFSGVLIKYVDEYERVVVAQYFS